MDPRLYQQLYEIERSHWWFIGRREILLATFDRLGIQAQSVLDVGCGAGTNLGLLGDRFGSGAVHGIDIELEPLRFCRADRAVPLYQADMAKLPFRSSSFDLVVALDALEHVEDDEAALDEFFRVCRPQGKLLLMAPAFRFLWGTNDEVGHHYRRYTRAELERKVSAAGFSLHFIRFFNYLLFPPVAAVRLLGRLAPTRRPREGETVWTDFDVVTDGPLNTLLAKLFSLEASLLRLKPPFGVSLLCVAVRDGG